MEKHEVVEKLVEGLGDLDVVLSSSAASPCISKPSHGRHWKCLLFQQYSADNHSKATPRPPDIFVNLDALFQYGIGPPVIYK